MTPPKIPQRLAQVKQRIDDFARSCDRDRSEIKLIAVSKTRPASDVLAAWQAGQHAFGENYLQDALPKIEALQEQALEWHFIGRIQSNKTREIAAHFSWAHTLASAKHARRLNEQRPASLPALNVCIQVNISGEQSKAGIDPQELVPLAAAITALPRLKLRGLMTMPPADADESEQRRIFKRLSQLKEHLRKQGYDLDQLSMGMSGDMHAAIYEGATMVRIGTAIFGPRT